MLSFEQIKELIELVAKHGLRGFEIERSGFRFKIDGQSAETVTTVVPTSVPAIGPPVAIPPATTPTETTPAPAVSASAVPADPVKDDLHVLTSPIVGTFYSAPSPDAAPFASVGATVSRGQVLCIVEAMKLMNEIESDVDGEIVEVMPQDAQPVEFGEPLFRIRAT